MRCLILPLLAWWPAIFGSVPVMARCLVFLHFVGLGFCFLFNKEDPSLFVFTPSCSFLLVALPTAESALRRHGGDRAPHVRFKGVSSLETLEAKRRKRRPGTLFDAIWYEYTNIKRIRTGVASLRLIFVPHCLLGGVRGPRRQPLSWAISPGHCSAEASGSVWASAHAHSGHTCFGVPLIALIGVSWSMTLPDRLVSDSITFGVGCGNLVVHLLPFNLRIHHTIHLVHCIHSTVLISHYL